MSTLNFITLIFIVFMVSRILRIILSRPSAEDIQKAKEKVANGAILLDVRSPGEFASKHIEGAINIPVGQLKQRLAELGEDKSVPIIVYCQSGARSSSAASTLKRSGFANTQNIGPMSSWNI